MNFARLVGEMSPFMVDRMDEIETWDDVKFLTVTVDRLRQWHQAGLLCIGDAAHAMSPVGGVGINLAVQDAVAAANIVAQPLRAGRRQWRPRCGAASAEMPMRITQRVQVLLQNSITSLSLA